MKFGPFEISLSRKSAETLTLDQLIGRLRAAHETFSAVTVTPENCMESPTVNAIVTAVSRRISVLPVRVMRRVEVKPEDGTEQEPSTRRTRKAELPNHPVQKLLENPNRWQDRVTFWQDATSALLRHGNFYAYKSRGQTGPIRELLPLHSGSVSVDQDLDSLDLTYRATLTNGGYREFRVPEIMHARSAARNLIRGDSPVHDIREAIGLEITAERMGASVFGNSAMPSIVFKHGALSRGFKTEEEEKKFIDDFQAVYAKRGRFKSMMLPFGLDIDSFGIDNEKAQFLATRQYQRTVIAGAFGVPPHMVGDLSRGTFNNVESQSLDFSINVVVPYARIFEAAMERSLLTDEDRRGGVIIRFDLDAAIRGSFKERQEGLKIQREMGVISPNDWREHENMNPISKEDGGETYWVKGPSGQGADPQGEQPPPPVDGSNPDEEQGDNDANA